MLALAWLGVLLVGAVALTVALVFVVPGAAVVARVAVMTEGGPGRSPARPIDGRAGLAAGSPR